MAFAIPQPEMTSETVILAEPLNRELWEETAQLWI
jgi:hypothetical protein